jgi:hypothetical protein
MSISGAGLPAARIFIAQDIGLVNRPPVGVLKNVEGLAAIYRAVQLLERDHCIDPRRTEATILIGSGAC